MVRMSRKTVLLCKREFKEPRDLTPSHSEADFRKAFKWQVPVQAIIVLINQQDPLKIPHSVTCSQ